MPSNPPNVLHDLLIPGRHLIPWGGETVVFHSVPGGEIEASSRGVAALGRDEGEALDRLGELLDWWQGSAGDRDEIITLAAAPMDSPTVVEQLSPWPLAWPERESA